MINSLQKATIESRLVSIGHSLAKYDSSDPSLFTGTSGVSLFYYALFEFTSDQAHLSRCQTLVETTLENIEKASSLSFQTGISGIGWLLRFYQTAGIIDIDEHSFFEELDKYIYVSSLRSVIELNVDLMNGGMGTSTYALSRLPNAKADGFITQLLQIIDKNRLIDYQVGLIRDSLQSIGPDYKAPNIRLGLAHGLSGILNTLLRCYMYGFESEDLRRLIQHGLESLKDCSELVITNGNKDRNADFGCNLSWAYGLIGVAATFSLAAKVLNQDSWRNEETEILRSVNAPMKCNSPVDPFLSEGDLGTALCVKHGLLLDSSNRHISRYYEDSISRLIPSSLHFSNKHSLDGLAGAGLALIDLLSDKRQKWPECLLFGYS